MPRGKLSDKQVKYTQLVASGMKEDLAVLEAGYDSKYKYQAMNKLKNNDRIQNRINLLQGSPTIDPNEVASRDDREAFWTSMMKDPKNSGSIRLEASKLLGKAQGDFIDRKEIETNIKTEPVVMIPLMNPGDWESYWEDKN